MRREFSVLFTTCALPMSVAAQAPASVERAVSSITATDMYNRIGVMAHDSMGGRDTPSPGLELTAGYIAAEFEKMGLSPGGDDGTFIQRYPISTTQLAVDASTVSVEDGPQWRVGPDVLVRFGSASQPLSGSLVVVDGSTGGLGAIQDADLTGSVVLIASPPAQSTGQLLQAVFGAGAAAIFMVSERSDNAWNMMRSRQARPVTRKGWGQSRGRGLFLEIREAAVAPVLRRHGYDLAPPQSRVQQPVSVTHLRDLTISIDLQYTELDLVSAPNVVGILEGSDPALKNEYVLFSAHIDHVGTGRPVDGDSIFNGADDDASGTAAIIEAAEAYTMLSPRPKRSMIFLGVSGEEKGLWGSEYFSENPGVDITQIVADLNADMVSRNWKDTVVVIGKEHSDLGETLSEVNQEHPELSMHAIDDIWPEERFYFRSDHYNFARRGVPILFFFTGTHEDYHQVTDEVERIDADKAARITRLMFHLGLEVANSSERPQWDPESYSQIVEVVP